jgi:hypothetical protein
MNLVLEQWPFLLQTSQLMHHYETLMGFNLSIRVEEYANRHGMTVYQFDKSNGLAAVRHMATQLKAVAERNHNMLPQSISSMLLLPGLLKEPEQIFYKNYDVSFYCITQQEINFFINNFD